MKADESQTLSAPKRIHLISRILSARLETSLGDVVVSVPIDWRGGAEIKWLTEVEAQLRRARTLLTCLDHDREISAHIDDALAQALSLRITRMIADQEKSHPEWTESGLWPTTPISQPRR